MGKIVLMKKLKKEKKIVKKKKTIKASTKKIAKNTPAKTKRKLLKKVAHGKSIKKAKISLSKHPDNPIISPGQGNHWESRATFNPAVIYEDGKIHLAYRAVGDTDVSVIGYASSGDGFNIDEKLQKPIYIPREPFEGATRKIEATETPHYSSYMSGGGGWGGCEDPRMTVIDGKVYMTYSAYNGWSFPRTALTSILLEDFLNKKWKWEKSVLISPDTDWRRNIKSACIFPEKIKGKYVIIYKNFHPKKDAGIVVDFFNDLEFDGKKKFLNDGKKKFLKGEGGTVIFPRKKFWDSRKLGVSGPPIKTKYGWLFFYHGVGYKDPSKYKLGAVLLDLNNPKRVIARSDEPVLEPEREHEGNFVYCCGSVIVNDKLFVYYGGADRYVCVATVDLNEFLDQLMISHKPKLKTELKDKKIKNKNDSF